MSMSWILDTLAGPEKRFDVLDRGLDSALDQHAEEGADHYYSSTGKEIDAGWSDVKAEIRNGPGLLQTPETSTDFEEGLGYLPEIAEGHRLGKIFDIDDLTYAVFYFEPSNDTTVVEETEDTKLLASPYVIGETYQFTNLETGKKNYTRAEHRRPGQPVEESLERPNEKFY